MLRDAAAVLLRGAALAALLCALSPGAAHAASQWRFDGVELEGQEAVAGDAVLGTFTVPAIGTSVVCKKTHYAMDISNKGTSGQASMNSLSFSTCTATSPCTVEEIEAEAFPWPALVKTVGGKPYFVVKGFKLQILFGGVGCPLDETFMPITGTAGALYDNPTETLAFSPANFAATGSKLVAFGSEVEWPATFTTEAEFHEGEALTVG